MVCGSEWSCFYFQQKTGIGKDQEISLRKLFVGPDGLVFISLPSPISSQVGGTPADRGIDFPFPLFFAEKLKGGVLS